MLFVDIAKPRTLAFIAEILPRESLCSLAHAVLDMLSRTEIFVRESLVLFRLLPNETKDAGIASSSPVARDAHFGWIFCVLTPMYLQHTDSSSCGNVMFRGYPVVVLLLFCFEEG